MTNRNQGLSFASRRSKKDPGNEVAFCKAFVVEFYLKLKLILRIITYLTYIYWEIDNFVIKSDIFRGFFICKNILKKLSCYHDNYFKYFTFGKYNGFVSKERGFCMHVFILFYLALPTRAGSPQQHMPITVGPFCLTHPVNFPCGRKPEYPEETHDFRQSVDFYSFHVRTGFESH